MSKIKIFILSQNFVFIQNHTNNIIIFFVSSHHEVGLGVTELIFSILLSKKIDNHKKNLPIEYLKHILHVGSQLNRVPPTRDVCCIILCHLLHMCSGKTGNLFSLLFCSLWWVQIFGYVLAYRLYSFVCTVHHLIIIICANLYEGIKLIKCLSDIFCWVCE